MIYIGADHGNAEMMYNSKTGAMNTEHSTNPVPFIIIEKEKHTMRLRSGRLADVAPTVLELMGIPKPKEMTGKNLIIH
jgi:2,3-bisphosphoglycerate-independent phosphoglycerate mutase